MQLWQQADKQILWLWDDSRLEKPESEHLEGLCPVFSSKGQRITGVRKGFFRPPRGQDLCTRAALDSGGHVGFGAKALPCGHRMVDH